MKSRHPVSFSFPVSDWKENVKMLRMPGNITLGPPVKYMFSGISRTSYSLSLLRYKKKKQKTKLFGRDFKLVPARGLNSSWPANIKGILSLDLPIDDCENHKKIRHNNYFLVSKLTALLLHMLFS